jgi:tRNA U34 5-methylaminomethyl-2-thiouridine-forming methyltransferase MnmC
MTRSDTLKSLESTEFGTLVETKDGSFTIRHSVHGQDFHSEDGAKFEAWQLYVIASGYLAQLNSSKKRGLVILDVGMGLGYNASASVAAWLESDGCVSVEIISLELEERLVSEVASCKAAWQRNWPKNWITGPDCLQKVGASYAGELIHPKSSLKLTWNILPGDARSVDVSVFRSKVDFIWQDPFTPELNPSMWSGDWFRTLKTLAGPETVLVTYSVQRVVKNALEEAGWCYERIATPGRKRHWLRAKILNQP